MRARGYDSHGFAAQQRYMPLLGVRALVLYAEPQAPADSLLATAHGRLLLARTRRSSPLAKMLRPQATKSKSLSLVELTHL
jgi:hypothetical protein